ncbi:MAG: ATP-binding cassette domain-containing protein [[Clostridium] nexile]
MNTAIEFKNIKKVYGNKVVLERFNFSVAKGEFVTIIGSSGCGKTTVLKMINGLIEPTSGDIFVDGSNILDKNLTELRRNIDMQFRGAFVSAYDSRTECLYVPKSSTRKIRKDQACNFQMDETGLLMKS